MRLSPVHLPTHCDTSATRTWASLVPVSSSGLVEGKVCRLIDDGWLACFPPHIPDGSPLYPQAAHRGPKAGFQLRQRPIGSRDRTWGRGAQCRSRTRRTARPHDAANPGSPFRPVLPVSIAAWIGEITPGHVPSSEWSSLGHAPARSSPAHAFGSVFL
jgi:hypothetical protein